MFFFVFTEFTKLIVILYNDSFALAIDLENDKTCQNIADIPKNIHSVIAGFSGLSLIGDPLICGGGYNFGEFLTTCFELTVEQKWAQYRHSFNLPRAIGASAVWNGMLVAAFGGTIIEGGFGIMLTPDWKRVPSAEVLTANGWQTKTYPYYELGTCAVAINTSMILILNPFRFTALFDMNATQYKDGPKLLYNRAYSACAFHKKSNCVLVVGGGDYSNSNFVNYNISFSEVLCMSNETWEWQEGPGPPQGHATFENVLSIAEVYAKYYICTICYAYPSPLKFQPSFT